MSNVKVKDEIGVPDILVNNAGSYYLQVEEKTILMSFDHLFLCFQNIKGNLIDLFRIFVSATTPVGREW